MGKREAKRAAKRKEVVQAMSNQELFDAYTEVCTALGADEQGPYPEDYVEWEIVSAEIKNRLADWLSQK